MCYRGIVEKKTVLENLDLALLTIDEIIDGGCVNDVVCNHACGCVARPLLFRCIISVLHIPTGWCWRLIPP